MASIDDVMDELGELKEMLKKLLDKAEAGSGSGSAASPPGTYFGVPAHRLPGLVTELGLAQEDEILCVPLGRPRSGQQRTG
ncbi:MAG: hypothetical protein ACREFO_11040 [Acetobacteraceae bacterium]